MKSLVLSVVFLSLSAYAGKEAGRGQCHCVF